MKRTCSYADCDSVVLARDLCQRHYRREYMRKYRQEKPDLVKAAKDRYTAKNRDREAARARAWYGANKERANEKSRAWQAVNPEIVDRSRQAWRARQAAAPVIDESINRSAVGDRDGWICGICSNPVDPDQSSLDHVVPLSQGGSHTWDNVQISHPRCNSSKRNSLPEMTRT